MWQTIRSAAEAVHADDLALANAILAAGIILTPNETLQMCYDEGGSQYKVSQYCYANPQELTTQPLDYTSAACCDGGGWLLRLRVRINPGADLFPYFLCNCVILAISN
jgi:hypothetical protein